MQRVITATIILIGTLLFLPSQATAETYLGHHRMATHWYGGGPFTRTYRVTKQRHVRRQYVKRHHRVVRRGGFVAVQCGAGTAYVASSAARQFKGFCADFYKVYKFGAVGNNNKRYGRCSTGSKHPCGGAIDIEQTCRSQRPGHCLPRAFPVAASEQIAAKWGLHPGSKWRNRDVGHFECRNLNCVGSRYAAMNLPDPPEPKTWPIARIEDEQAIDSSGEENAIDSSGGEKAIAASKRTRVVHAKKLKKSKKRYAKRYTKRYRYAAYRY